MWLTTGTKYANTVFSAANAMHRPLVIPNMHKVIRIGADSENWIRSGFADDKVRTVVWGHAKNVLSEIYIRNSKPGWLGTDGHELTMTVNKDFVQIACGEDRWSRELASTEGMQTELLEDAIANDVEFFTCVDAHKFFRMCEMFSQVAELGELEDPIRNRTEHTYPYLWLGREEVGANLRDRCCGAGFPGQVDRDIDRNDNRPRM